MTSAGVAPTAEPADLTTGRYGPVGGNGLDSPTVLLRPSAAAVPAPAPEGAVTVPQAFEPTMSLTQAFFAAGDAVDEAHAAGEADADADFAGDDFAGDDRDAGEVAARAPDHQGSHVPRRRLPMLAGITIAAVAVALGAARLLGGMGHAPAPRVDLRPDATPTPASATTPVLRRTPAATTMPARTPTPPTHSASASASDSDSDSADHRCDPSGGAGKADARHDRGEGRAACPSASSEGPQGGRRCRRRESYGGSRTGERSPERRGSAHAPGGAPTIRRAPARLRVVGQAPSPGARPRRAPSARTPAPKPVRRAVTGSGFADALERISKPLPSPGRLRAPSAVLLVG